MWGSLFRLRTRFPVGPAGRKAGLRPKLAAPLEVSMALLIDETYEGFGFLRWSGVDVAQQAIHAERASPDQIGRIFDGL
jgi:hypothetical protein